MALWYYQKPVEHADATERIVADVLQGLDEEWVIRWGWYYEDNHGVQREGDFLIQSPQGHMLVLEVKATAMRNFALTGRWETDRDTDPIAQLYAQWQWVIKRLREDAEGEETPFVGHAFALPNVQLLPGDRLSGGMKRSMVLDRGALNRFPAWWREHFGTRPVWGKDHRRRFVRLFAPGLQPAQLKLFIRNSETIFSRFRGTEFDLLLRVSPNQQLLVNGGPGTSKTFMALKMAEMIATEAEGAGVVSKQGQAMVTAGGKQAGFAGVAERLDEGNQEGRHVLFVCYNLALGEFVREMVAGMRLERGKITVRTWEELAREVLSEARLELPVPESTDEKAAFYDEELPGYLRLAIEEGLIEPHYDALVVDEAQDIDTRLRDTDTIGAPGWWSFLFSLLYDGAAAKMAIFHDLNQRVPFRPSRFAIEDLVPHLSQPAFIRLTLTVRYTKPIFQFLAEVAGDPRHPLLSGLELHPQAPQGPEVIRLTAASGQTRQAVERILKQWFKQGLCKERDVCILGRHSRLETTSLGGVKQILSRPLIDYPIKAEPPTPPSGAIRYLSLHRAKGLDFLAVILIDEPCEATATFLLGASRARQLLGIVERPAMENLKS